MSNEGLSLENLMDASDFDWGASTDSGTEQESEVEVKEEEDVVEEDDEEDHPVSRTSEEFFDDDTEESGSGQEEGGDEGKGGEMSTYARFAKAFVEDGIFDGIDDEAISKVKSADDFKDLMVDQLNARLTEQAKRVSEALQVGVEPDKIRSMESTIAYLNSITEEQLTAENDAAENVRKTLIFQDYLNHGSSRERAEKMVQRAIKAGTDVEDAREALKSNKEYYNGAYNNLVANAKREAEAAKAENKRQAETLRKTIMEEDKAFGDVSIDKSTRRRVYDNIMKPVYKDPETGEMLSAIERYSAENRLEFLKNVGLLFTLTDGFKNVDKLVGQKVRKEMKKGIQSLERTINSSRVNSSGQLSFASGSETDPDSRFVKFDLNL